MIPLHDGLRSDRPLYFFGAPDDLGPIESGYSTLTRAQADEFERGPAPRTALDRLLGLVLFAGVGSGVAYGIAYCVNDVFELVPYASRSLSQGIMLALGAGGLGLYGALAPSGRASLVGRATYLGTEGLAVATMTHGEVTTETVRFAHVAAVFREHVDRTINGVYHGSTQTLRWVDADGNELLAYGVAYHKQGEPAAEMRFLALAEQRTSAWLLAQARRKLERGERVRFPVRSFDADAVWVGTGTLDVEKAGRSLLRLSPADAAPVELSVNGVRIACANAGDSGDGHVELRGQAFASLSVFLDLLEYAGFSRQPPFWQTAERARNSPDVMRPTRSLSEVSVGYRLRDDEESTA